MAHLSQGRTPAGRRWMRPALLLLIASGPVLPEVFLAVAMPFGALLAVRDGIARSLWRRETRLVIAIAALGCLAQLGSQVLVRPAPPVDLDGALAPRSLDPSGTSPQPLSAGHGAPNLIANSDLAWLRGWTRASGEGEYVRALEPGLWRIGAFDPASGDRYTEVRTLQEVAIAPRLAYTVSVLVRHDGSDFGGELVLRTREGQLRPGTLVEAVGPGMLRLTATLPPQDGPQRLRLLHLAGLRGDWTVLDIGFAQLVEGGEAGAYRPRSSVLPWYAGLVWWAGLAAALVLITPTARLALSALGHGVVSSGLLAGLGVQLAVALGQFVIGAPSRVAGTLGDPNVLAHAALVTALSALALSARPLRVAPVAAAMALVAVVVAGSHAGYAGALLAGIGLAVLLPVARGPRVAIAAVLAGAVAAAALFGPSWSSVLEDTNNLARIQVWGSALDLAKEWPLTGVGHGNLRHYHEFALPEAPGPRYRADHAHSLLGLAAEFGWPLALALLACLMLMLRRLIGSGERLAALALVIALLLNLVDLTLFYPALFVPLWLAYLGSAGPSGQPAGSAA